MWVIIVFAHTVILVSGVKFAYRPGPVQGDDFGLQPANLSSTTDKLGVLLWLTPDPETDHLVQQAGSVGRVVYNHAIPLFNDSTWQIVSFNTSFNFQILTPCGYGECGDGLAFSISPLHDVPGDSGGGSLGIITEATDRISLPDRHLFAVEFDTFKNDEYADPSASHIGIDFNGLESSYTFNTNDTQSDLYLYNNYTIFAWVEYIAPLHLTRVFAANSSKRPSIPCLNVTYDLSNLFDHNYENLYVAISAAASGLHAQGTALGSWNFTCEDVTLPLTSHSPPPSHDSTLVLPVTLSLSGVLLLAAACGFVAHVYKRRKQILSLRFPAMIEMIPTSGSVPRHSYRELKKATQGFSDKQKVGEGGFSSVYKGTLSTGDVVAVKRLKEGLRMGMDFASEIQIISRIRHRNLLQLRGWGYERGEALLVYQYMPRGSLDSYLFGKNRRHPELMDGERRFSILVGVAAALEYLHEGLGECVLHRDVKAANVMLTESFEAMLGDFGLARLITHNEVVTMTAAGTPGYVAPEVVYTGRATDKADVYSFGMLALEVACGRRALDESLPPEEMRLVDWVWQLQQSGKLMDVLDPACYRPVTEQQKHIDDIASDRYSLQELKWRCVLHVALLCCNPWTEGRPTMRQVHQTLLESLVLPLPSTRPTFSQPASSIFTSSINFSYISSSSSSALGRSAIPLSTGR